MSPFSLFVFRFSLSLLPLTASAAEPTIAEVESVSITVSDLDKAVAFYTGVLEFEKISEREVFGPDWENLTGIFGCRMRMADLRLGEEQIQLIDYLTPRSLPIPDDARANDRSFQHIAIVVSDIDRAYAHLRAHNVEHASTGPQTLPESIPAAAGISAFYFRDPDSHFLEVICFPPGKGDPRWQSPSDRLFLGIDHTAIVVESTDESLKLYRDTLGLQVVGTSTNQGDEQAHLNNVQGAHLRITTLRAPRGPGIELLEYLHPRSAIAPRTPRACDIEHWHVTMRTSAASMMNEAIARTPQTARISVETPHPEPGVHSSPRQVLWRDRDHHAFLINPSDG